MKKYLLALMTASLLFETLHAQTADFWISQGRSYLTAHDLANANASFAQAVTVSPTNQTANAFYAATRLLVLPAQPAGSNFLTRLGFPLAGRNFYHWTAKLPKDVNHLTLAPAGVSASELPAQLRTNVLFAIAGAIGNLSQVTDTNFTLALSSSETASTSVTLDYGDLKLIQAGLYAAEYFTYTLNAQNLDAQLTALRSLYTSGQLSAGQILASYPQLFTVTTTSDLPAAETAFTNAVNAYLKASVFIRARPANQVRLFNYNPQKAQPEADFRLVLQDLNNSLVLGPQMFALNPDYDVDAFPLFDGSLNLRNLLPQINRNAVCLGSMPDLTFDNIIYGLTQDEVEQFLGKQLTMLPVGNTPIKSGGNTIQIPFNTLRGHFYVMEVSTNLIDWRFATNFVAADVTSVLPDSQMGSQTKRFYRLRDDSKYLTFSGVVLGQVTGQPIAGAQIYSQGDGTSTFSDSQGHFYLKTSIPAVPYPWDNILISAPGYISVNYYYYASQANLTYYLSIPPANDNFASRFVLSGSVVSTNGNNAGASWESGEPTDAYSGYGNKSVWFTWTAPFTGTRTVSVAGTSFYNPILAIYTGSQLASLTRVTDNIGYSYSASYTLSAVVGTTYQIEVDDYSGNGGPYTLSIGP